MVKHSKEDEKGQKQGKRRQASDLPAFGLRLVCV
jgi:hypothetical protein